MKAKYEKLPNHYSNDLRKLVKSMLTINEISRPSLNEILGTIKNKLREIEYNVEEKTQMFCKNDHIFSGKS